MEFSGPLCSEELQSCDCPGTRGHRPSCCFSKRSSRRDTCLMAVAHSATQPSCLNAAIKLKECYPSSRITLLRSPQPCAVTGGYPAVIGMPENDACLHQQIRDLLAALPARFRRGLPGLELAHRRLLPFSSFRRDDYLPVHSQGPEPDRIHGRKLTIQQPGGLERSDHVKRSRRHDPQAIPPQQHKVYAPLFRIGPVARASWVACLKRLGESLNRCDSVGKLCLSATVISDLDLLVAGCGTSTVECVFESSLTAPSNQCLDVLSTQQDSRGLRNSGLCRQR